MVFVLSCERRDVSAETFFSALGNLLAVRVGEEDFTFSASLQTKATLVNQAMMVPAK